MSKRVLLGLCLLSTLILACGQAEPTNTGTNSTTATNNTAAPPANNAAPKTASGDKIGVADCDDFIAKYEACVTDKVPAASRDQFQATLTQWRSSWKQLAANPQAKPMLETACKNALEQARTSMKPYNCAW